MIHMCHPTYAQKQTMNSDGNSRPMQQEYTSQGIYLLDIWTLPHKHYVHIYIYIYNYQFTKFHFKMSQCTNNQTKQVYGDTWCSDFVCGWGINLHTIKVHHVDKLAGDFSPT